MLLQLCGVTAGYGTDPILHDIDLYLRAGEIVTLIGANGAGKSTLVKTVSGLLKPMSGRILFEGSPIQDLSTARRLSKGIAHVPEGRQIFAGMMVAENLRLGTYGNRGEASQEQMERVFRLFPVLKERFGVAAGNFSGGQQQLLAIARGLMSKPRLLMLDEPSLGLSPLLVTEIFHLIRRLRDDGLTILLVEQNARSALAIADRGYVIENGRVTLSGSSRELLHSQEVAERYLGVGTLVAGLAKRSTRIGHQLREAIGGGTE